MASRQRRSKVWLYFMRKDDHKATCNACKTSISTKGGNTTNKWKHLSTQYAITLQECHVFDALRSDDHFNESQPGNSSAANVSASSGNIKGKLLQTLSIVLVPFVSLLFVYVSFIFSSRRIHLKKKKKQHCNWQVQILFSTAVLKLWYIKYI